MKKIKYVNDLSNENIYNPENKIINKLFDKKLSQDNFLKKNLLLIFKCLIIVLFVFFYLNIIIIIKKYETKNNNYSKLFLEKENGNNEFIMEKIKKIFIKYKRDSIDWPLPKEIIFKPLMTSKELKAFCFFMKPGNIYFEFGSGGSTNIASFYKVKTYSVESDVKWHKKLKENNIKANYITIDLKVHSGGYPGKKTNIKDWEKYIKAYKREYNANIILIDGRFRVACGLDIFSKIKNDCIVLIHDYNYRNQYHILEKYYLKIKSWGSLSAFIKRPNINFIPKNIFNKYIKEKC